MVGWKYAGVSEQRKAALMRKLDAEKLLAQGRQHGRGAMYLAGYSIECKVKAIAMERHGCATLGALREALDLEDAEVYNHKLESLLKDLLPKGTYDRLVSGRAGDAFKEQVNRWTPQWRYDGTEVRPETAKTFMEATDQVYQWLEANA